MWLLILTGVPTTEFITIEAAVCVEKPTLDKVGFFYFFPRIFLNFFEKYNEKYFNKHINWSHLTLALLSICRLHSGRQMPSLSTL